MNKRILAALLLSLVATRASATGLVHLPPWHQTGDMACYSFEEAKELVKADYKLQSCVLNEASYTETKATLLQFDQVLKLRTEQVNLALAESTKLKADLEKCIDDKAQAEVKAASGPSLGWLVAGGALLLTAGIIVGAVFIK